MTEQLNPATFGGDLQPLEMARMELLEKVMTRHEQLYPSAKTTEVFPIIYDPQLPPSRAHGDVRRYSLVVRTQPESARSNGIVDHEFVVVDTFANGPPHYRNGFELCHLMAVMDMYRESNLS